jgi:hypothetical protein
MISKIVSGGQTGVDGAALDFAIARGIAHGGFCPKGRRSENGRIADIYNLTECSSPAYVMRTALKCSTPMALPLSRKEVPRAARAKP